MSYEFDDDLFDGQQFSTPQALRDYAEKVAKQNKALERQLAQVQASQREQQINSLFADYDDRVKSWVPQGADPADWLKANAEILPRKSGQVSQAPEAQAPVQAPASVAPEVQAGFEQVNAVVAQGTGPGTSDGLGREHLAQSVRTGGLDALEEFLASQPGSGWTGPAV